MRATHSPLTVLSYAPGHLAGTVEALAAVRNETGLYPPPQDTAEDKEALSTWLLSEPALGRWVAIMGERIIGHVQVTPAHDYLIHHLDNQPKKVGLLEVGKLFVHPSSQGSGAGRKLLAAAQAFAAARNLPLALAVLPTSEAAIRLYQRQGFTSAGDFQGVHGLNHVYLAPSPWSAMARTVQPALAR